MISGELLIVFLTSLAGSYHCLGMCGGIACGLASDPQSKVRSITRHLVYNTGRVVTYVFLGAAGGALGWQLASGVSGSEILLVQKVLTVLAGVLMILMSLKFLRKPASPLVTSRAKAKIRSIQNPIQALLSTPGNSAPLALGVLNGFLPCPLVYAFLTLAVSSANPLDSMVLMAVFGLGTFPAMLVVGSLGLRMRLARKPHLVKIAGLLILLFGLLTITRAFLSPSGLHRHMAGL